MRRPQGVERADSTAPRFFYTQTNHLFVLGADMMGAKIMSNTLDIKINAFYMGEKCEIPITHILPIQSGVTDSMKGLGVEDGQVYAIFINPSESFGFDSIALSQLKIAIRGGNLGNHIQVILINRTNPEYIFVASALSQKEGQEAKMYIYQEQIQAR